MRKEVVYTCLFVCLLLSSCIREEALNSEADITTLLIDATLLKRAPIVKNNEILVYLKKGVDCTALAPLLTLSEGATVLPASGTKRDFTRPQKYMVTSQDRAWKKEYTVAFITEDLMKLYAFETLKSTQKQYDVFIEQKGDEEVMQWGSGNLGFSFTAGNKGAEWYPTSQDEKGYKGKCAKLTTYSTGPLGEMMGKPMAPGNLFIGEFELNLTDVLRSTHLGMPIYEEPIKVEGMYKYKRGAVYKRKNKVVPGEKDRFHIYAVLYETNDTLSYLDGTNALTNPLIVASAELSGSETSERWTPFVLNLTKRKGKVVDLDKLTKGIYSFALVFASSKEGASFNGAEGSTLWIDEVKLITK